MMASQAAALQPKSVLITGAGGYIGRQLTACLARDPDHIGKVVATDLAAIPEADRIPSVHYEQIDVRSTRQAVLMQDHAIDSVVHLASIVSPSREMSRQFLYEVEVLGTENIIQSCLQAHVDQLVITSSGAAYGYHHDNPTRLDEGHPLRGNAIFAYSDHKRQVEECLAEYRRTHPDLKQLIFRPGTVLGSTARNQITALFDKPVVLGVAGSSAPFVFIWDEDLVACLHKGICEASQGIFNLAGDGTLGMKEIAGMLGKFYLPLPASILKAALWVLAKTGLTRYGPEQVGFLQYRPVLSNRRLKEEFGYIPSKTTRETFAYFMDYRTQANEDRGRS
jgi:UDP-glucose 4-epimerase